DPVGRAVILQFYLGRDRRPRPAVDLQPRDAGPRAIRVLDGDLVARGAIAEGDRESGPGPGYAGRERQHRAADLEAEKGFEGAAIQPSGRSRIPGPAAAPIVRVHRVDVGGHDIGLDAIAVDGSPGAAVVDRVEQGEELCRSIALAEHGQGHDRPARRMGVLATVFPDAGWI